MASPQIELSESVGTSRLCLPHSCEVARAVRSAYGVTLGVAACCTQAVAEGGERTFTGSGWGGVHRPARSLCIHLVTTTVLKCFYFIFIFNVYTQATSLTRCLPSARKLKRRKIGFTFDTAHCCRPNRIPISGDDIASSGCTFLNIVAKSSTRLTGLDVTYNSVDTRVFPFFPRLRDSSQHHHPVLLFS